MIQNCIVCFSSNLSRGHRYNNISWPELNEFNNLTITYCKNCGQGFIENEPANNFINDFYFSIYRNHHSPFFINFSKLKFPSHIDYRSFSQIELGAQFVKISKGDYFVDIGPGEGTSFNEVYKLFPGINRAAIEMNKGDSKAYKRIYNIQTYKSINQFLQCGLKAKIALLSHSLEHYKASWLNNILHELKRLVGEEGIIIVEVPNNDFRNKINFVINHSPHCLFFSIDSIRQLFENNGWDILYLNTVNEFIKDYYKKGYSNNMTKLSKIIPRFKITSILKIKEGNNHISNDLTKSNFKYGGQRVCLRMIAKLHKHK